MSESIDAIILDFLNNRSANPRAFVRWCGAEFVVQLRRLKHRGHNLPLDMTDPEHAIENLAIDIAGNFLSPVKSQTFGRIFQCLERNGFTCYSEAHIGDIKALLRGMIFHYTRQYLSKILQTEDPQIAKLRRRVKSTLEAMAAAGKIREEVVGLNRTMVWLAEIAYPDFDNKPLPPYGYLIELAHCACDETLKTRELCLRLLKLLAEQNLYQRRVSESELISALVTVVAGVEEYPGIVPGALPSQTQELLRGEFIKEIEIVLHETVMPMIDKYVDKGKVAEDHVSNLYQSFRKLFYDMINCGDIDMLPRYFYGEMPEHTHDEYLDKYKNLFESIYKAAINEFFQRCKNNPTIRRIWGYSN